MKKQGKIYYGWFVVAGCVLINCTMVPLVMALSGKYLIQVTTEMQISRSAFTITNTLLQAMGIVFAPIFSKYMARGNMRLIQSLCIVGFAASYATYALAQNVYHLYISSILLGIFYCGSTIIPIGIIITNWFDKKRGLAMSFTSAGIGIGGFIFSPIVTWLLNDFGWRTTYVIMAVVVILIALPISALLLRKKPEDMGLKPYGSDETLIEKSKESRTTATSTVSYADARKKSFFYILLGAMLLNEVVNSGAVGQFPPAIEEMHGPAVQATIISMYSLVGIFGRVALGAINDRFGGIVSSIFGAVCFALACFFMLLGENIILLYVMAIFFGFGNPIGTVLPPLITSAIFNKEDYAKAWGIVNSCMQVGLSAGSLLTAAVYDVSGSYSVAWISLLVIALLVMLGWIWSFISSRKLSKALAKVEA